jgi:transcriptional repressor CTCF
MSKTRRATKIKEENEIQSYINSFKEIEEPEEEPSTSKKGIDQLETEDYEQIIVRDDQVGDDDEYKYVFIVQDEEDGGEEKVEEEGEVYEFDEYEEDMIEESDDKAKIVKIVSHATKKPGGQTAAAQGQSTFGCSFCNYSTPKRYLLARHMKCHSEDR